MMAVQQPEEERSGPRQGRPDNTNASATIARRADTIGLSQSMARQHVITGGRRRARAFDRWAVAYYGTEAARTAGIRVPATESGCGCRCSAVGA